MRSLLISTAIVLGACQNVTPVNSTYFPVADWRHEDGADQPYLLAPGDTIQLVFHSAPELDREVKIAPDGSISLPFIGAVQASARTSDELQDLLLTAYSNELRDPQLDVIPVGFDSQRIFVGGEVATPGMMELPGQIDPLQAIIMAGSTIRALPALRRCGVLMWCMSHVLRSPRKTCSCSNGFALRYRSTFHSTMTLRAACAARSSASSRPVIGETVLFRLPAYHVRPSA